MHTVNIDVGHGDGYMETSRRQPKNNEFVYLILQQSKRKLRRKEKQRENWKFILSFFYLLDFEQKLFLLGEEYASL